MLLYCTPKMHFFTVDHQALLHSLQKKVQIFFLTFLCIVFPVFFLIGLWEFPFWIRPSRNHTISYIIYNKIQMSLVLVHALAETHFVC